MLLSGIYYGKTPITRAYKNEHIIWSVGKDKHIDFDALDIRPKVLAYITQSALAAFRVENNLYIENDVNIQHQTAQGAYVLIDTTSQTNTSLEMKGLTKFGYIEAILIPEVEAIVSPDKSPHIGTDAYMFLNNKILMRDLNIGLTEIAIDIDLQNNMELNADIIKSNTLCEDIEIKDNFNAQSSPSDVVKVTENIISENYFDITSDVANVVDVINFGIISHQDTITQTSPIEAIQSQYDISSEFLANEIISSSVKTHLDNNILSNKEIHGVVSDDIVVDANEIAKTDLSVEAHTPLGDRIYSNELVQSNNIHVAQNSTGEYIYSNKPIQSDNTHIAQISPDEPLNLKTQLNSDVDEILIENPSQYLMSNHTINSNVNVQNVQSPNYIVELQDEIISDTNSLINSILSHCSRLTLGVNADNKLKLITAYAQGLFANADTSLDSNSEFVESPICTIYVDDSVCANMSVDISNSYAHGIEFIASLLVNNQAIAKSITTAYTHIYQQLSTQNNVASSLFYVKNAMATLHLNVVALPSLHASKSSLLDADYSIHNAVMAGFNIKSNMGSMNDSVAIDYATQIKYSQILGLSRYYQMFDANSLFEARCSTQCTATLSLGDGWEYPVKRDTNLLITQVYYISDNSGNLIIN